MPNLAHLMKRGTKLPVDAAVLPGIAYPTLYSGARTADLGMYFPVQWMAAEQRMTPWNHYRSGSTIFERVDAAGGRTVVLDAPECEPVQLKNGFVVSGLQFRARVLLHGWSSDEKRYRDLVRDIGEAPRADEVFGTPTYSDLAKVRNALLGGPARLKHAALDILCNDKPDCLWVNCCALHVGGHQFFDAGVFDRAFHDFDDTRRRLAKGYDEMLGALLEKLPAGADVLVFWAKGMQPAYGWPDLLPGMLRRILNEPEIESPITKLRSLIPQPVRRFVADRMPEDRALQVLAKVWSPASSDWSRTRAFCVASDCTGFIRVNLRGREVHGCVDRSEMPAVLDEIKQALMTFTDEDGETCVESMPTAEELLGPGAKLDLFPDLFVFWKMKPNLRMTKLRSPRYGEFVRKGVVSGRSGFHGPGAFAVVAPGKSRMAPVPGLVQSEDIPATILAALGVPHDDLPGRPLLTTS